MEYWEFIILSEWLMVARGKNENGEFIKLKGPNFKGGATEIFFPAGKLNEGWLSVVHSMKALNVENVVGKTFTSDEEVSLSPTFGPQKALNAPDSIAATTFKEGGLDVISWNQMIVIKASNNVKDWKAIGFELGKSFKFNNNFHFQPFSSIQALFCIKNPSEREFLFNYGVWNQWDLDFTFVAWSSKEDTILSNPIQITKPSWVLVRGVPFSLWNSKTFESIGAKCGGLIQVSPYSLNGWDILVLKLQVKAPLRALSDGGLY